MEVLQIVSSQAEAAEARGCRPGPVPAARDVAKIERVYPQLKRDIMSGVYSPNERLVEAPLTRVLGVSRNTLRTVLARLEREALVVLEPNRGGRVRAFSPAEAHDMLRVREVLEGLVAELAAERASSEQRDRLKAIVAETQQALEDDDLMRSSALNRLFHDLLIEAARQPAGRVGPGLPVLPAGEVPVPGGAGARPQAGEPGRAPRAAACHRGRGHRGRRAGGAPARPADPGRPGTARAAGLPPRWRLARRRMAGAGIGIADVLRQVMIADGLSPGEATSRFWALGSKGLLAVGYPGTMRDFQVPYARRAGAAPRHQPAPGVGRGRQGSGSGRPGGGPGPGPARRPRRPGGRGHVDLRIPYDSAHLRSSRPCPRGPDRGVPR